MSKLCKCKIPNIQIKNSENGISWYCKICAKQYEVPNIRQRYWKDVKQEIIKL